MAKALELALEVLPHLAKRALAGEVRAYGVYASAIGRSPAKESMVIGQAMHTIGAACVFAAIPVAPLHFVQRSDGEWRGVFRSDVVEEEHVLPHYELLYVTARAYKYSADDFSRIEKALRITLPKHLPPDYISPHHMWHAAAYIKLKDGTTFLHRALTKYREILDGLKSARG